jgi:hypothetical protein
MFVMGKVSSKIHVKRRAVLGNWKLHLTCILEVYPKEVIVAALNSREHCLHSKKANQVKCRSGVFGFAGSGNMATAIMDGLLENGVCKPEGLSLLNGSLRTLARESSRPQGNYSHNRQHGRLRTGKVGRNYCCEA